MIDRETLSEPARRLHDRLSAAGRLPQFEELATMIRGFAGKGWSGEAIADLFDCIADRLDLDPGPGEWGEFEAAIADLASLPA